MSVEAEPGQLAARSDANVRGLLEDRLRSHTCHHTWVCDDLSCLALRCIVDLESDLERQVQLARKLAGGVLWLLPEVPTGRASELLDLARAAAEELA